MKNNPSQLHEHRNFIRLDSVFPVQFRAQNPDAKSFISDWLQGFTNNIGKGGLCLSVNNLNAELIKSLKQGQVKLWLEIDLPVVKEPIKAKASISWVRQDASGSNKYVLGLRYVEIDQLQNNKIMRYARAKQLFVPAVIAIVVVLGLALAVGTSSNAKLTRGNKALVEQLIRITQESDSAKEKIKEVGSQRSRLQAEIMSLEQRIRNIQEEKLKADHEAKTMAELDSLSADLAKEKDSLQSRLASVRQKEDTMAEELELLAKRKESLVKANFEKMYQWLKVHQNPRTGLIMSFEGDSAVENWGFIYDQSLAAQAYTNYSDFQRARKIFDFFSSRAQRQDGMFFNAYYVAEGAPAEYTVHSGPNIWLGIAVLQYTNKAKDSQYLNLARDIARSIINLQNKDKDAGIPGGPSTGWYSTEHNLDAYAFFNMFYKISGERIYREARDKILNWLTLHTYDKADLPVRRGKGDSTIATDTYAWSIAAIGPQKLGQIGMDPDKIMEFAEKNCAVTVDYLRPEGKTIKIKGFDFAAQRNVARGGVVSSEWTAQMVLSLKIMADFYNKKNMAAKSMLYNTKAEEYLSGLGNMVISSLSASGQGEGCLPYATQDNIDTGHGWFTPKGKSTGSVAGTAYTLFAYNNYNPLELKD